MSKENKRCLFIGGPADGVIEYVEDVNKKPKLHREGEPYYHHNTRPCSSCMDMYIHQKLSVPEAFDMLMVVYNMQAVSLT